MKPVLFVEGRMAPLPRRDVDTDQIMPKQFLKRVQRTGFGEFVFHDWMADQDFELNQPQYRGANVLVTGPNFGSGSSREHAAWGLQQYGFEAIVAPSFADIFRSNCAKNGLLTVELPHDVVDRLMAVAADPDVNWIRVDVASQSVTADGVDARFELAAQTRTSFLNGVDEIDETLADLPKIQQFEQSRPRWAPVATAAD